MIIYKATNIINKKQYIGLTTTTLKKRISSHLASKDGSYFHRALKKYGSDMFTWEILRECDSKDQLSEIEIHYIEKYNTFDGDGYNLTKGGEGMNGVCGELHWLYGKGELSYFYGKHLSDETKQKLSDANKGKMMGKDNPFYGKTHSEETKRKISEVNKILCKGDKNGMYGKNHSEETKRKIGDASRKVVRNGKKFKITLPTSKIIIIENLKKFCQEQGLIYTSVHTYMKRKKLYKGYFVEEVSV